MTIAVILWFFVSFVCCRTSSSMSSRSVISSIFFMGYLFQSMAQEEPLSPERSASSCTKPRRNAALHSYSSMVPSM